VLQLPSRTTLSRNSARSGFYCTKNPLKVGFIDVLQLRSFSDLSVEVILEETLVRPTE
jgi:hypothetical protein